MNLLPNIRDFISRGEGMVSVLTDLANKYHQEMLSNLGEYSDEDIKSAERILNSLRSNLSRLDRSLGSFHISICQEKASREANQQALKAIDKLADSLTVTEADNLAKHINSTK